MIWRATLDGEEHGLTNDPLHPGDDIVHYGDGDEYGDGRGSGRDLLHWGYNNQRPVGCGDYLHGDVHGDGVGYLHL